MVQALPKTADGADATGVQDDQLTAAHQAGSLDALVDQQPTASDLTPEMRCLAGAIYFEARGESLEGQLAVGRVVVNRSKSGRFPASYCGVVYQPSQFSFVRGHSMPAVRTGSQDWQEAMAVARIADQGSWKSEASEALFFHAARVSPSWRLTRLARVDNHIFYR
jgi:spore germination cell wall hydrolase CwlJ-like protein